MTKKRQAIVVSFSGVDGAGKSTQILSLLSLLDDRGVSSAVVSFWDQVVTLRGIREFTSHSVFRGEKGIGSPEKPVKRRDKNVQTRTMTLVRCFFYFLDALHTRLLLRRLRRDEFDVIVFDRYLYDELANLPLTNKLLLGYAMFLVRLASPAEIGFVLDADPKDATGRKPEYPLDFVVKNRANYLALAHVAGLKVVAPGEKETVHQSVVSAIIPILDKHLSQHSKAAFHRSSQGWHMVRRTDEDLSGNHISAKSRGLE